MKKVSAKKLLYIVAVLAALVCAVCYWMTADFGSTENESNLTELSDGWYYRDGNGKTVSLSLPGTVNAGSTLELLYGGNALKSGQAVATYAAVYDVELYAGDTLLYRFCDNDREINDAVRANIVCTGTMPEAADAGRLRLVYHSKTGYYVLPAVTASSQAALFKSIFGKSLFCLIVSISMLIVGALTLVFAGIMNSQKERDARVLCISLFLIACGLWCLSDSAFIHFLMGYNDVIFSADFYLFMVMPIPLGLFVLNTGDMKRHKVLHTVVLLYFLNIIVQSLLAAFGVFTFFKMLYATHILMMVGGVFCSLFVLLKEYRRHKANEVRLCIHVLSSVGILGLIAITLYVAVGYSAYQLVYQTGLLILMMVLLNHLLKEFMQAVRYRAEVKIYKQLSEQDKLTKLDNRRSFDTLLEKMENGSLRYQNAALLFMDVNFLKKANDEYGHAFGDQLLICAAQCIRSAYGKVGFCYRIGGDEFCAVLLDPSSPENELRGRIQAAVEQSNREHPLAVALSLACGCSFIVEGETKKTINAWKTDADGRMYEDKKRIKAVAYHA